MARSADRRVDSGQIATSVVALHLGGGLVVTGLGIAHTVAVLRSASAGTMIDATSRLPGLLAVGAGIVVPGICMVVTGALLRRRRSLVAPLTSTGLLAASLAAMALVYGPGSGGPVAPVVVVADLAVLGGIAIRRRRARSDADSSSG